MSKISSNKVKAFLKEHKNNSEYTFTARMGNDDVEVKVKTRLDLAETRIFINRVLSGCFDENDNFCPEYVVPMFNSTVIQLCTNLPVITEKHTDEDGETKSVRTILNIAATDALYRALGMDLITDDNYLCMVSYLRQLCNEYIQIKLNKKKNSGSFTQIMNGFVDGILSRFNHDEIVEAFTILKELSVLAKSASLNEAGLDNLFNDM